MDNDKVKLLVVEDSANERFLISTVFRQESWEILEAEDGLQGLELACKTDPDLILLDVQMPRMGGIEMLKQLRANPRTKDLLIIVLTGNATQIRDLEQGFSIGADEYLFKPFDIDELRIRVNNILRRRKAEKALQQLQADFIAMLIHDLKSPLTAICGFAELLLRRRFGEVNEQQARCLQSSLTAGHKMLTIINDALDLSKFEAGQFVLSKRPVNLGEVLVSCFERLQPIAEQHGIEMVLELVDELPVLEADDIKLDQVVTNLLSNALKFTPPSGKVRLTARRTADASGIEVAVRDSGPGIAEEEQHLLFQKYRQTSTSRLAKGTGLGLAICKSIIEAHEGRIWVESDPSRGSRFAFTIPLTTGRTF
ncbi:MAG: hybrid sensor histidine kinase/response regulator [Acidobacteriota bacterium]